MNRVIDFDTLYKDSAADTEQCEHGTQNPTPHKGFRKQNGT